MSLFLQSIGPSEFITCVGTAGYKGSDIN